MDYYSLLGVNKNASADEIKKAYRKASMKHHPDRGGDEAQFKKINEAYDTLSDPQKRQMHDMGVDPNRQQQGGYRRDPFEFHFNSGNFNDIFGDAFGFRQQRQPRNKTLNIVLNINLEDVLNGKTVQAQVAMPGGASKNVTIDVPAGIEDGQHIRYSGLGDDRIKNSQPGDLIVNIRVMPHSTFTRIGDNIVCEKHVSVWDCMIGSSIQIENLDLRKISINIPPGTQPDTVFSCKGEGIPNVRSKVRGNLLIKIKVDVPKHLTEAQKQIIQSIRNG